MKFSSPILTLLCLFLLASTAFPADQNAPVRNAPQFNPSPASPTAPPAPAEEDIRDIRGPIHLADPWLLALAALGVVAVLVLLFLLIRWILRRRQPTVVLPPHERALLRLRGAEHLILENKPKDYCTEVSETVRLYIEERFGVRAAHETTEEFLNEILQKSDSPLARYNDLLGDFLALCDLVKFANLASGQEQMRFLQEGAVNFVRQTVPQPNPQPATGPRPA
ncbi:MAG: hypothetical protein SFY92_01520 [Verrucomicrobiae bacterium]|nr:hypothetical protein [Verrucomicrobiae bacterium]